MKTIAVKFLDGYSNSNTYHYVVDSDLAVEIGDHAVVHNGSDLRIVRVVDVLVGVSSKATRGIVTLITTKMFEDYKTYNVRIKEQKALYNRLEQLLAAESEISKYRVLAASNAEAAQILKTLNLL